MFINCDIGEFGANNKRDDAIMRFIDMANIACGGHAGDIESVKWYVEMARKYNKRVSAHISYPDRENFGRASMQIGGVILTNALDRQWNLINRYSHIKQIETVKFHGALYNDSVKEKSLARFLACWALTKQISSLVTDPSGWLAKEGDSLGLNIIPEFFAERTYVKEDGNIRLSPRSLKWASIKNLDEALVHTQRFIESNKVKVHYKDDDGQWHESIEALNYGDNCTICVHSDSEIALKLTQALSQNLHTL